MKQSTEKIPHAFSTTRFLFWVVLELTVLLWGIQYFFPALWERQRAHVLELFFAFVILNLPNSLFEYILHRWFLHAAALIGYFAKKHRIHHALTRVMRKDPQKTGGPAEIQSFYEIKEERQRDSSRFPFYALAIFFACFIPLFLALDRLFPALPWMLAGCLAVAWSFSLYEITHAIEHWPYERWQRFTEHPRFGWLGAKLYGFHLMHHANMKLNMAVGGFFLVPLWDFVFRTHKLPKKLLVNGEFATQEDLSAPEPRFIGWIDRWIEEREKQLAIHS